ncbi:hypothetical protein G7Y89_g12220 [Cudoniella acicularis]|uniref:Myb-like domain-containing protein n=1 Tax=Cudoniella acicularis TaxID=354080 RepID=A0A8H4RAH3_9HELO|nr:hypothetical protein G7Y89_g12220 [Cudoniella acicularis]
MLLPSAFSCDSTSQQSSHRTRFQSALFASPPLSPPSSSSSSAAPTFNNIYSTCRALQSMLTTPSQLPSPPTQHTAVPVALSSSPVKLRLRARKSESEASTSALTPRKKITKRSAQSKATPPRGLNKRRRALDDDLSRDSTDCDEEAESSCDEALTPSPRNNNKLEDDGPRTPKRMRLAPEVLPLGLERGDFHTLHLQSQPSFNFCNQAIETTEKEGSDAWSTEEDRLLVELVLEKLKLTKSDWQDCARSLGKDRSSVGKRWKSLMGAGEVGLKHRPRRAKLHGTWR